MLRRKGTGGCMVAWDQGGEVLLNRGRRWWSVWSGGYVEVRNRVSGGDGGDWRVEERHPRIRAIDLFVEVFDFCPDTGVVLCCVEHLAHKPGHLFV